MAHMTSLAPLRPEDPIWLSERTIDGLRLRYMLSPTAAPTARDPGSLASGAGTGVFDAVLGVEEVSAEYVRLLCFVSLLCRGC